MIESTAIRYFRVVTECGSIKQAAAALRIAPSAISRQVQGLEDELAVKLFERGARGMNLTDAGHLSIAMQSTTAISWTACAARSRNSPRCAVDR